ALGANLLSRLQPLYRLELVDDEIEGCPVGRLPPQHLQLLRPVQYQEVELQDEGIGEEGPEVLGYVEGLHPDDRNVPGLEHPVPVESGLSGAEDPRSHRPLVDHEVEYPVHHWSKGLLRESDHRLNGLV